jgi:stage V sporulation protein AB
MVIRCVLLAFFGLGAGAVTAAGYFAIIAAVGVVTRFAEYTKTASKIRLYEIVLSLGAIVGNYLIIFRPTYGLDFWIIVPVGILCGMFTGCFLLSLAEVIKGFPVFLRKAKIQKGISVIIIALAFGKTLGSIFYFCCYLAGN